MEIRNYLLKGPAFGVQGSLIGRNSIFQHLRQPMLGVLASSRGEISISLPKCCLGFIQGSGLRFRGGHRSADTSPNPKHRSKPHEPTMIQTRQATVNPERHNVNPSSTCKIPPAHPPVVTTSNPRHHPLWRRPGVQHGAFFSMRRQQGFGLRV